MPLDEPPPSHSHRHHHLGIADPFSFYAAVARPVNRDEVRRNPKAQAALDLEWTRLRSCGTHGCWDESHPRDKREVIEEARRQGRKVHFGQLMELCVEKNAEIPDQAKFKGRVVYRGDCSKDEWGKGAIFRDLGSCPATLESAKVADFLSCSPQVASGGAFGWCLKLLFGILMRFL